jgi:hypothetical protein
LRFPPRLPDERGHVMPGAAAGGPQRPLAALLRRQSGHGREGCLPLAFYDGVFPVFECCCGCLLYGALAGKLVFHFAANVRGQAFDALLDDALLSLVCLV